MYLKVKKVVATLFLVCVIATSASAAGATRNRDSEPVSLPKKIVKIVEQLRRLLLPSANDDIGGTKP